MRVLKALLIAVGAGAAGAFVALFVGGVLYTWGMTADQLLQVDSTIEASTIAPFAFVTGVAAAVASGLTYYLKR